MEKDCQTPVSATVFFTKHALIFFIKMDILFLA